MYNGVQEIFNKFGYKYLTTYKPSREQLQTFNDIKNCHTKRFGGRIYKCKECGYSEYHYNSCRNRFCPNCQAYRASKWIDNHEEEILDIDYYHVVMAVPVELRTIFYHNQQVMYDKLFKISSDILLEVFSKYLNIEIGITSMLHTWSQRMEYHPHMHMIITAGGVNNLGKWVDIDSKQIPIDKIRKLFRDRLVKVIKTSNKIKMYGSYEYLNNKDNLFKYLDELYNQDFVCYLKKYDNIETIYEYLGKYAYKVCISNERIVKITDTRVTFTYRDRYNGDVERKMSVRGEEFIRKFLMNVLPKGFIKIRYYGIIAGRDKSLRINKLRILTNTKKIEKAREELIAKLNELTRKEVDKCPKCHGKLEDCGKIKRKRRSFVVNRYSE